jgi:hypothetical protein
MPIIKTLEEKLARIRAGRATRRDFILADAKDADMAFGLAAPGPRCGSRDTAGVAAGQWKSLDDYRQQIRSVVAQGVVDLVLLSTSNLETLAIEEQIFASTAVTPAARANDTTDIWCIRGGKYSDLPSRPFRSATIEHIKYGRLQEDCSLPHVGADLGLYSLTFTNDLEADYRTLMEFTAFRREAEEKHFRYFLEVFNPNVGAGISARNVAGFVNDHVVRTLAGIATPGRPLFLKIPYNGPAALEELVAYDPGIIVGIMGGSAGTTRDAFQLLHDAQKHGARAALFGRKINLSEQPLVFVEFLRRIADGEIGPVEAVKAYHASLVKLRVTPHRPLRLDLQISVSRSSHRR